MNVQKKDAAPAPALDSLDEIDKIMSEIEGLQKGMASAAPAAKKAPAPAPAASVAAAAAAMDEANVLDELQAGSGEVSMEETLGELKDDGSHGPDLIDQAIGKSVPEPADGEESPRPQASVDAESPEVAELLAEVEAAGTDDLQIEDSGMEEENPNDQQEVEPMTENMRRPAPRKPSALADAESGSVDLTLAGNLGLRLRYEYEGQEVMIRFAEGALHVELSDGTEFRIPVRRNSLRKVA